MHTYHQPPDGEICFDFSSGGEYRRQLIRCRLCGHFISVHKMDTNELYTGDYVSSNYEDESGLNRTFQRIVNLLPEDSDNIGRARRVQEFSNCHFNADRFSDRAPTVLDVGSGLCVFLYEMKKAGWDGTALDPDRRSAKHASETVGVRATCGDFRASAAELGRYDLVTFNKVLEHVEQPVNMLAKARAFLLNGGFVYLELPDGEAAFEAGPSREEFFIDHLHVFSMVSLAMLATQAGFVVSAIERLQEPSSKFTLRAFLIPSHESASVEK